MDHQAAVELKTTERYLLGELTTEEREAFEGHYFDCRECADSVASTAVFLDNARPMLLHDTVRTAQPATPQKGWWWKLSPAPMLAALALLGVFSGYQAVLNHRLEVQLAAANAPQTVSTQFLTNARSAPETVTAPKGASKLLVTLASIKSKMSPYLRCELKRVTKDAIPPFTIAAPPAQEEVSLLLPVAQLSPGAYDLILRASDSPKGPAGAEVASYRFLFKREE